DFSNTTPDAKGNFGADPLFVDAAGGDFHLQFASPCIDTGSDAAVPVDITTDLGGSPRKSRAHVDLGAYEYQNQAPVAASQAVSLDQDTSRDLMLTGSDAENDALTYQVAAGPTHGVLSGTAPTVTYTPNGGFAGLDTFDFAVTDAYGASSKA